GSQRAQDLVYVSFLLASLVLISLALVTFVPTFEDMRKSKQTSFYRSLYSSSDEIIRFYATVRGILERLHSDLTAPLPFHKVMDELAQSRPYFQHYTQNIDCIEHMLPDLDGKTIRLHGRVDQAKCQKYCQRYWQRNRARILKGQRSLRIGELRPDVLLYGEPHPDEQEILETVEDGLRICPDLVLIVGTKLGIPGARSTAANFCHAARIVGGASFWISKEDPVSSVRALCDYVLIGDCDKVAPLDIFKLSN
ncbi:DHS-like NAD/FAD-binding domain-containing protein, partial [Acephala macrosclerotiorum]